MQNNRDLYRFMWSDDPNEEPRIHRFKKLLMGAKCSPYQSNSTIKYNLKHLIETAEDPSVVKVSQKLMRTM